MQALELKDNELNRIINLITGAAFKVLDYAEERMKAKGCSLEDLKDEDPEVEDGEHILNYVNCIAYDYTMHILDGTEPEDAD